jgi:rSAM/selenodomain-associated transferase 1
MADTAIAVFAKPCIPGQVKTRLVSSLGSDRACRLYKRMLEHALRTAAQLDADHELWLTTLGIDHKTETMAKELGFCCRQQCSGDLGVRMAHAFQSLLPRYPHVLLMGSDCPALSIADLAATEKALSSGSDVVLLPVEDGGYALIGMSKMYEELFEEIPWGTSTVSELTRQRLRLLGGKYFELSETWDVDRAEDLKRLADFPHLTVC